MGAFDGPLAAALACLLSAPTVRPDCPPPVRAQEVDFGAMEADRKREMASGRAKEAEAEKRDLLRHMMLTGKLEGLKEQARAP